MTRDELRALAHALLLAEVGGEAVGRLCPRCGSAAHGRPYVAGSAVRVSLSYATDLVAVAWADGPVGIDVEDDGPPVDGRSRAELSAGEAAFKAAADVPVVGARAAGRVRRRGGRDRGQLAAGGSGSAGSPGSVSQASNSPSRSAPVLLRGERPELVGGHRAAAVLRDPGAQQLEERVVADGPPQRVQGERAALVDAVVEHQLRAGVAEDQVLRLAGQPPWWCSAQWSAVSPPDASDHSHSL